MIPLLLRAQYAGGNGRGDASASSYILILPDNAVFSGGNGRGDISLNSNVSTLPAYAVYSGGLGRGDISNLVTESSLPVMLSSFTASVIKNNVTLRWTTEAELNNSGFELQRKAVKEKVSWQKVTFIDGRGSTSETSTYSFEDKKLQTGKYDYRLKQIDFNGNFEYFDLSGDVVVGFPKDFHLSQNYPNPSNPKSKIDYDMPVTGKVNIKLYDLLGREVIQIVNEDKEAGYYTAEFDGTNLASGVYFYRIIAEGQGKSFNNTLKLVLIK